MVAEFDPTVTIADFCTDMSPEDLLYCGRSWLAGKRPSSTVLAQFTSQTVTHAHVDMSPTGELRTQLMTLGDPNDPYAWRSAAEAPPSIARALYRWAEHPMVVAARPRRAETEVSPRHEQSSPGPARINIIEPHPQRSSRLEHLQPSEGRWSGETYEFTVRARQGRRVLPVDTRDPRHLQVRYGIPPDAMAAVLEALQVEGVGLFQLSVQDEHDMKREGRVDPEVGDGQPRRVRCLRQWRRNL